MCWINWASWKKLINSYKNNKMLYGINISLKITVGGLIYWKTKKVMKFCIKKQYKLKAKIKFEGIFVFLLRSVRINTYIVFFEFSYYLCVNLSIFSLLFLPQKVCLMKWCLREGLKTPLILVYLFFHFDIKAI